MNKMEGFEDTWDKFFGVDESSKCNQCGAEDAPHEVGWDAVRNVPLFRLCDKCKAKNDAEQAAEAQERIDRLNRDIALDKLEQLLG